MSSTSLDEDDEPEEPLLPLETPPIFPCETPPPTPPEPEYVLTALLMFPIALAVFSYSALILPNSFNSFLNPNVPNVKPWFSALANDLYALIFVFM